MSENLEQKPKKPDEFTTPLAGASPRVKKAPMDVRDILKSIHGFEAGLALDPQDEAILKANEGHISPEWRVAIMSGGVDQYHEGKKLGRVFAKRPMGHGGMGVVFEGCFVRPGSTTLEYGVIKVALEVEGAEGEKIKTVFEDEKNNATKIKEVLTMSPHETGVANIAKPLLVADKMIVYEKVEDEKGNSVDLNEVIISLPVSEWLSQFAGGVQGLAYLHRNGLHHFDFKPNNIVVGKNGEGVLIDYSAIREQDKFDPDYIVGTPAYYAPLTFYFQMVSKDPIADSFAVGICLRTYLLRNGFLEGTMETGNFEQKWHSELPLNPASPPPIVKLYEIYKKLSTLPKIEGFKPEDFIKSENYIPLEEVAEQIKAIAKEVVGLEKTIPGSVTSPVNATTVKKSQ